MLEYEVRGLLRGFQIASGFRLQGQSHVLTRFAFCLHHMRHTLQQVGDDQGHGVRCAGHISKTHRHR